MICKPCRQREHQRCDNKTRSDPVLVIDPLNHGSWCDCQHQPGSVLARASDDTQES